MRNISSPRGIPMAQQSQKNIANDFVNITIPENLWQVIEGKALRSDSQRPLMQKVPQFLRSENELVYDPLVVSIGPYHHHHPPKPELQAAEDFKPKALQMLVEETGKDFPFYYTNLFGLVNDARNCYIKDSINEFDDPTFAQMMLLDASFIINFILLQKSSQRRTTTLACFGQLVTTVFLRDMFLLENQIPFRVLKLVLSLGYGEDKGQELLSNFVTTSIFGTHKRNRIASSENKQPFHLLDAFRLVLAVEPRNLDDKRHSGKENVYSFRSVRHLKSKGIHFKPSSADFSVAINFKSGYFFARLELPTWYVSFYTKVLFSNVIAYELCSSTGDHLSVTAYIHFMKSLIDSPEDVKELREKRILFTTLGKDEDVAKVYNEINIYGFDDESMFPQVKEQIQAHYDDRAKTWLAELLHTYFRSPWTVIALLAAIFLAVLTCLQTYLTVNPSSDLLGQWQRNKLC